MSQNCSSCRRKSYRHVWNRSTALLTQYKLGRGGWFESQHYTRKYFAETDHTAPYFVLFGIASNIIGARSSPRFKQPRVIQLSDVQQPQQPQGCVSREDTETSMLPFSGSAMCVQRLDDSLILQFALRIAFRCVLHRRKSQDIHC